MLKAVIKTYKLRCLPSIAGSDHSTTSLTKFLLSSSNMSTPIGLDCLRRISYFTSVNAGAS